MKMKDGLLIPGKKEKRKLPIYGNCKVFSPDNILMYLCTEKKINWFLKRNLAERLPEDPLSIKLKFEPKGLGTAMDEYGLSSKKNKCVVCGSEDLESLSKHHIVPFCYRKCMPEFLKSKNSHDIIPICFTDHYAYEKLALQLKDELAIKYNAPLGGQGLYKDVMGYQAARFASTLLKHGSKIPIDKRENLKEQIRKYLGVKKITKKVLKKMSNRKELTNMTNYTSHGEMIMSNITDLQEFVEMWRKHFLEKMSPKFMPEKWSVNRPVQRIDITKKEYYDKQKSAI
jgi:hypothetical protein